MKGRSLILGALIVGVYALMGLGFVLAQEPPPPGQGQGQGQGQGGRTGRFDPEQMRQRRMDFIKEQLQASDKEWEVLSVAVDEVMKASRAAGVGGPGGPGMFGRGRGRAGGPGGANAAAGGPGGANAAAGAPGGAGAGAGGQGGNATIVAAPGAGAPGGGEPGGGGAADQAAPPPPPAETDVEKAAEELRTLLENKDAAPDEIKAKVQALRDARAKAKKELEESKSALHELVTPWQEAQLVLMGILD